MRQSFMLACLQLRAAFIQASPPRLAVFTQNRHELFKNLWGALWILYNSFLPTTESFL